ncbi:MAG: stage III sporulation protein AB [Eubacterium sp.]|nr:stage III sporulation protein AB [Eubacterium sp.]
MIILFSSSLGLMAVKFKKRQLSYIDSLIYIAQKIQLMLSSTSPETDEIMSELKNDDRLKNFDFELLDKNCPLSPTENDRSKLLFDTVGKYDLDCQLSYIDQYIGYFKMLKQEYQDYYNSHYKLYLVFGLFSGVLISVLLI